MEYSGTERFRIARCGRCGFRYLDPRPSRADIGDYYPTVYYTHVARSNEEDARTYAIPYELVSRHGRPGRLLDVGAGDGAFLALLERNGWSEVYGVEPDEMAAGVAREHRGLSVSEGALPDFPLEEGAYATITMLEVIEHLHEPLEALRALHRALQPGGRLILTTPNIDGVEFRLLGSRSISLQVPRHLVFFDRETMVHALEVSGFDVTMITTSAATSGLTRSLWLALRRRTSPIEGSRREDSLGANSEQSWRRSVHRFLDRALHPIGWIAARARLGPTLLVVATRR